MDSIIAPDEKILVTGANGFLGSKVTGKLLGAGFTNIRCFVRSGGDETRLSSVVESASSRIEIFHGNLTIPVDCYRAAQDVVLVVNCAAGMRGGLANMIMDSAVSSRNLLDAISKGHSVKRIVHVSSIAVYEATPHGRCLNEQTPVESHSKERNDAYSYTKIKQEEVVWKYYHERRLPIVVLRPGVIFGPGGIELSGRVGLTIPGKKLIIHVGPSNLIPLTYVDNCADAVVLAATKPGIVGEIFNIHDDDLPRSGTLLRMYLNARKDTRSLRMPYLMMLSLSRFLTWYSHYSKEQIPAIITPHKVESTWKRRRFDNGKAKEKLGWVPTVPMEEALREHFEFIRRVHSG